MLAVMLALICTEVERLKGWSRAVAFSAGFLAQDGFPWMLAMMDRVGKWFANWLAEKYQKPRQ